MKLLLAAILISSVPAFALTGAEFQDCLDTDVNARNLLERVQNAVHDGYLSERDNVNADIFSEKVRNCYEVKRTFANALDLARARATTRR